MSTSGKERDRQVFEPVVCVVDGDPAVRDSLRYLCNSRGRLAEGFSTRSAFLRCLDVEHLAYTRSVICEAQLPDGSGVELFEELRQRGLTVPFALLVSRRSARAAEKAMRVGIEYIWPKPLVDRTLLIDFLDIDK